MSRPPNSVATLCHSSMKLPRSRPAASTFMRERRTRSSGCERAKTETIVVSHPCAYLVTGRPTLAVGPGTTGSATLACTPRSRPRQ
eukprot:3933090-Rhodomonas_salina.2